MTTHSTIGWSFYLAYERAMLERFKRDHECKDTPTLIRAYLRAVRVREEVGRN